MLHEISWLPCTPLCPAAASPDPQHLLAPGAAPWAAPAPKSKNLGIFRSRQLPSQALSPWWCLKQQAGLFWVLEGGTGRLGKEEEVVQKIVGELGNGRFCELEPPSRTSPLQNSLRIHVHFYFVKPGETGKKINVLSHVSVQKPHCREEKGGKRGSVGS